MSAFDCFPENETHAADIIRQHAAKAHKLVIKGGGTRGWARQTTYPHSILSSAALTGITAYNPHEMVMTALSGTPVGEIEEALEQAGQMMAFEPADHRSLLASPGLANSGEPTIGGVFAANISGSRRFVAGGARDSLLGVRFINGRGEVIKNGGRVMKNVTGLDLVKLLAGSFGTLGFLSEVTFRVPPRHMASCSLVILGLSAKQATHTMAQAMALPVAVSGAAHISACLAHDLIGGNVFDNSATFLRLEGLPQPLKSRREKLRALIAEFGSITCLEQEMSLKLWREIRDVAPFADGTQKPVWRISVAPSIGHQIVEAMRCEGLHDGEDVFYDWQGGLVWLRMQQEAHGDQLRHLIQEYGGGHASLIRAGSLSSNAHPTLQTPHAALAALSKRVKQAFDPVGIFPDLWGEL